MPGVVPAGGSKVSRTVVINPVTPNRAPKRFHLGLDMPARSDGLGGWQEVPRPRRKSLTEYVGPAVDKLDLSLQCDGFPHTSVQADVNWLADLGGRDGNQSPVFRVTGPVWMSGQLFVLNSLDWNDFIRDANTGVLVRQNLTLHCWKYEAASSVISGSPAKKHSGKSSGSSHPNTYTVRAGDTLQKIAARFYGSSSDWHKIAAANNLRDPNYLKAGQVLKLP